MKIGTTMRVFLRNETASASDCYGLVVALIALTLLVSIQGLGDSLNNTYAVASGEPPEMARCVEAGSNCKK